MNWHLISYADETFAKQQRFLHQMHKEEFVHHPFTREDLVQTNFYQENKKILDQKTGAGYWLWKPYYILEVLKSAEENDFVSSQGKDYVYSIIGPNWIDTGETETLRGESGEEWEQEWKHIL